MSGQRVMSILQPGNIWVVEKSLHSGEKTDAALRTCHMRGWVEPIEHAIPQGELTPDGRLPDGDVFQHVSPLYRLTEAGWQVVHRTKTWIMATFTVALATLVASIISLIVAVK